MKLEAKPSMRLSQMQDIGGCRAVVGDISTVYRIRDLYKTSQSKNRILQIDDYISKPQSTGYRSLHVIVRYQNKSKPEYNGLTFEVQLRTELQHAWATAVETVGAILGQHLKGGAGEKKWLAFFRNASYAFACLDQPGLLHRRTIGVRQVARNLARQMVSLRVEDTFHTYKSVLKETEKAGKRPGYYLLVMNPEQQYLSIKSYSRKQRLEAFKDYFDYERVLPLYKNTNQLSLFPEMMNYSGAQVVLVGAEDLQSIRAAYPNYYLNTNEFIENIRSFIDVYSKHV